MVAIIGIVGLAIDGGGAYAQRRDQQTAADLAALAAANDYLVSNNSTQAVDPGPDRRRTNDFTDGSGLDRGRRRRSTRPTGSRSRSTIESPHRNSFLGALGMSTWHVSTTATALAGFPDTRGRCRTVHLLDRRVRRRRDAEVPDLDRLRRDERRRPDERQGHRLDELRDGQRQHARGLRHHRRGRRSIDQDAGLRRVHRPAQQRQPHDAVRRRRHLPVRHGHAGRDRRRQRQLHGLGDVPREQRAASSDKHINGYFLSSFDERPD